VDSSEML
jgi:glucose-6-phosphate isomerase (EC 5.3.1.9)